MSWENLLKARRRCSWCGNPKGWNGKDCISCNRGDFEDEELVETHSEMSDEERERLQ